MQLLKTHRLLWRAQFLISWCYEQARLQYLGFWTRRNCLWVTTELSNDNGLGRYLQNWGNRILLFDQITVSGGRYKGGYGILFLPNSPITLFTWVLRKLRLLHTTHFRSDSIWCTSFQPCAWVELDQFSGLSGLLTWSHVPSFSRITQKPKTLRGAPEYS